MASSHKVRGAGGVGEIRKRRAQVAATVFFPQGKVDRPTVMFALPGGGYGRGYFDMHFTGHSGYSQAEHHVGARYRVRRDGPPRRRREQHRRQ